jgi:hypothetical protein
MDPPAYVRLGAVDLLHAFQVSLSCWPHTAPPPADDMLAVEIAPRDALAGEAAANARPRRREADWIGLGASMQRPSCGTQASCCTMSPW